MRELYLDQQFQQEYDDWDRERTASMAELKCYICNYPAAGVSPHSGLTLCQQCLDDDYKIWANGSPLYLEPQYQECVSCGDFYDPSEISELGFCPSCMDELQEVETNEA